MTADDAVRDTSFRTAPWRLPRARTRIDDETLSNVRAMLAAISAPVLKRQETPADALAILRNLSSAELGRLGRDLLLAAMVGHAGEHSLRALRAIGQVLLERELDP